MGLLDILNTPQGQALAGGLATYMATAKRGAPVNSIGRGLLGGITGYGNAIDAQKQEEQQKYMRQMQDMQMKQAQFQMDEANRKRAEAEAQRAAMKSIVGTPNTPYQGADTFGPEDNPFGPMMNEGTGFLGGKIQPNDLPKYMLGIPGYEGEALKALIPKSVEPKFDTYYDTETGQERKGWVSPNQPPIPVGGAKSQDAKYKERTISPDGKNYVKQFSLDGGMTWNAIPESKPYAIRDASGGSDISLTNKIEDKSGSKFAEGFGGEMGKDFAKNRQAARDAAASIPNIVQAKQLLASGINTGTFANFKTQFGRGLNSIGFNVDPNPIANTEAFIANAAKETAEIIKNFGAGTGLSDADREYARQAAGGEITWSAQGLKRILDINEKARRNLIKSFNLDAEQVQGSSGVPMKLTIDEPMSPKTVPPKPNFGEKRGGYYYKGGDPALPSSWVKVKP